MNELSIEEEMLAEEEEILVEEEVFVDLYNSGLTHVELQSVFNCGRTRISAFTKRLGLKREKPKPDFSFRCGTDTKGKFKLGKIKGTKLKKCRNPDCDFYYYGQKRDRYCCKKCAVHVSNLRYEEYRRYWVATHKERVKEYERKRRLKKLESV